MPKLKTQEEEFVFVGQLVDLVLNEAVIPATVFAVVQYDKSIRVHLDIEKPATKIFNVDTKFIVPRK